LAGKGIEHKPLLRAFQRFLGSRPLTTLLPHILPHVDRLLFRLSGGRTNITRLAGLPVVEVTTLGAKSGIERRHPLAAYPDGDRLILIASNFGRANNPAWYYNLRAHPVCTVTKDGVAGRYIARDADEAEYQAYWQLGLSYYSGYANYRLSAPYRRIPILVLEPEAEGAD
jgi:deazaflavin-dependent oxidoreductase (nitroreductase family)